MATPGEKRTGLPRQIRFADAGYGIAAALSTPDSTPDPTEGAENPEADGAEEGDGANEASDEAIDPARAAEAAITETEAQAAAVAAVGGGTASDAVLGDQVGVLIFEVDVTDGTGVSTEVAVDAATGEAVVESDGEAAEDEAAETESDDVDKDGVQHENEHEGENDPDEWHAD